MESVSDYVSRLSSLVGGQDPMRLLAESPRTVLRLVTEAGPEVAARRLDPPRWSINEIVAHLADAEIVGAYRLRTIVATSGAPLQAYDQDRWAQAFRYESLDAFESAQLFLAYRAGNVRLLRSLSSDELERFGVHAERGRETAAHLARLHAGHDLNHIQQIERALALARGTVQPRPFQPAAPKPEIPLDALDRIDIRVGTILAVDLLPGARHVVRLTVDLGSGLRTVIAGLKDERSDPSLIVGRQALFCCNLAPRRIRGEESQAMLFDVGHADGLLPALAMPEFPVPNGTRAG